MISGSCSVCLDTLFPAAVVQWTNFFLNLPCCSAKVSFLSGRLFGAPLTGKTGILFPLLISVHLPFYCSLSLPTCFCGWLSSKSNVVPTDLMT